jgi:hypothetical protein
MENYYLDWSELTKRVYITNGKKKKDVTEWFDKIASERGATKIAPSTTPAKSNEAKKKKSKEIDVTIHLGGKSFKGKF